MGSLSKRLGQWSKKSWQSESASLFKNLKANKVPGCLSLTLDGTLQEGHDMKVFGMGTLASIASRVKYQRFLTNMHAIYSTMEEELDATSIPAIKSSVIRTVWKHHHVVLRRSQLLSSDLQELEVLSQTEMPVDDKSPSSVRAAVRVSPMTLKYLQAIRHAGELDRERGSGRLLGHLYCRYFADLFGGQMLGKPYQLALQLPQPPRHLQFDFEVSRKAYLEHLYGDLNKAGKLLTPAQLENVKQECILAFQHNVNVYAEEPYMIPNAAKGGMNLVLGWATSLANY